MIEPERHCENCSERFTIRSEDQAFYRTLEVPPPTWCPTCRHLRRHGHINDYVFYARACDHCARPFVAIFPPGAPYRVFCQECFYAETRDDRAEGRAWDPTRSFFAQFDELMHAAPQMGIIGRNNDNCAYCESVANCRDCYLISECSNCEDALYSYWIQKTISSLDCAYAHECEQCYEIIDCFNCYQLFFSQNCAQCRDSYFLEGCIGCTNCIACTNLRHKQFCIFNEQLTADEFKKKRADLALHSRDGIEQLAYRVDTWLAGQPRKALQITNVEKCFGDYTRNSKNCFHVFHCYDAEDCAYGEHVWRGAHHCLDANTAGRNAEWIYESTNCGIDTSYVKFSRYCWSSAEIEYCNQCFSGRNLFGCVSLKPGARYCILNQQYSADDYFAVTKQIKQKMQADGEYGEFFPLQIALFGFNNTPSFDEGHYTKEQVLLKGWKWEEASARTSGKGTVSAELVSGSIAETPDSITREVLTCISCAKNYRIISRELAFYRTHNLPIPLFCFDCRHRVRLSKRNGKRFREIRCTSCNKPTMTTRRAAANETIYCPTCYDSYVS